MACAPSILQRHQGKNELQCRQTGFHSILFLFYLLRPFQIDTLFYTLYYLVWLLCNFCFDVLTYFAILRSLFVSCKFTCYNSFMFPLGRGHIDLILPVRTYVLNVYPSKFVARTCPKVLELSAIENDLRAYICFEMSGILQDGSIPT